MKKILNIAALLILPMTLISCGGGGGATTSDMNNAENGTQAVREGYAVDDYVVGGTVNIYSVANNNLIETTETRDYGKFSWSNKVHGVVRVEINNGFEDIDGLASTTNDHQPFTKILKVLINSDTLSSPTFVNAITTGIVDNSNNDLNKYNASIDALDSTVRSLVVSSDVASSDALIKQRLESIKSTTRYIGFDSLVSELGDDGKLNKSQSVSAQDISNIAAAANVTGVVSTISDAGLKLCIADSLKKNVADLTATDLSSINDLKCSDYGLTSVNGIDALKNLKYFTSTNTDISDIKPFANMPSIQTLSIRNNRVSSISPLLHAKFSDLELQISDNCVTDMPLLSGSTNISYQYGKPNHQFSDCYKNDAEVVSFKPYITSTGAYMVLYRATYNPAAVCTIDWGDGSTVNANCDAHVYRVEHKYATTPTKPVQFLVNGSSKSTASYPNQKPTDPPTTTCIPPDILKNGQCLSPIPSTISIITDSSTHYVGESFNVTVNGEDLWQNMSLQITDGVCTRISTSLTLISFTCSTSYAGYKTIKAMFDGGLLLEQGVNIETRTPSTPVITPVVITLEYLPTVTYGNPLDVTIKTDNPFMLAKIQWADGIESPVYALNGRPATIARLRDIGTRLFTQIGLQSFTVRAYDESNNLLGTTTGSFTVTDSQTSPVSPHIAVNPSLPQINETSRFSLSGNIGSAITVEWSVIDSASNVIESVAKNVSSFFDYVFTQSGAYTVVAKIKDALGNILGQATTNVSISSEQVPQVPPTITSNIFTNSGTNYVTNEAITFNVEGVTPQYTIWEVYDGSPVPSNLESSTRVNFGNSYTHTFTGVGEKTVVAKVYYSEFSPSNFYLYSTGTLSLSIRDDSEISPENNVLLGSTVTDSCSSNCAIGNGDLSNITDGVLGTLGDIGSPNGGLIIYPKSAINLGRMILRSPVYINDDIDYEIFTSSSPVDSSLPPIWKTQGRQEMRTNISTPLDIIFTSPETNVTQVKVLVYHGYPSAVEFSEIEGYP